MPGDFGSNPVRPVLEHQLLRNGQIAVNCGRVARLSGKRDSRPDRQLSEARMLLLGAAFTSEYAIEGAVLCNPSIVVHPDQTGTAAGSLRFVMSVRGIGEGHHSSIGFRTGVVDAAGRATIDDPAPFATVGTATPALLDAAVFRSEIARLDDAGEAADYVLNALGERFMRADLDEQLCLWGLCQGGISRGVESMQSIPDHQSNASNSGHSDRGTTPALNRSLRRAVA